MPSCFSSCCISRKFSSRRSNLPLRKSCQDLGRRGWFTRAGRWIDNREGRDEGRAKLPLSRLFPADVAARQEARPPLAYRRPPDTVTRTVSHAGNRPRMGEALKGRSNLAQAARRDRSCFCESNVASPPTPGRPFRAESCAVHFQQSSTHYPTTGIHDACHLNSSPEEARPHQCEFLHRLRPPYGGVAQARSL